MCLLMVKPAGIPLPSDLDDICDKAYAHNSDGAGFCTRKVHWRSADVKPKEFCQKLMQYVPDDDAAIIHWRFGTSGGVRRGNCHPFWLKDGTMFAHNGVISNVYVPSKTESDTLKLALAAADYDDLKVRCEFLVSNSNKFAILPRGANKVEIIGEQFGNWSSDGMWYSNDYWRYDPFEFSYGVSLWKGHEEFESLMELEDEMSQLIRKYGMDVVENMVYLLKQTV